MCHTRGAAAALLMLAFGTAYGATKTVPVRRTTAVPAGRAKAPAISDAELEKSIRARFAASKISTHHFQVHVQGGVATIEGQTDVLQHKGTATRLAKNAGAVKVVNHVAVSQAAKDKARKNLASGRRRAQIKRSEATARSAKRSS
ncbi:MAG TPA: BON domain-containing protein [Bryobacteraceae bacterium]|nr:BON domain-containing protein [Bryobacteraceae bacterium]